jgi:DNA-binding response OmpR family regulator/putative methionine-R-sulfoxide reductase with GAF domain
MTSYDAGILVVDDETFFREQIREILERNELSCVVAESGEEALEKTLDTHIGAVILDITMPSLGGIQVLARMRELRPTLHVIMLSGSTDQELVIEALRLGACDYLAKPIHEEELVLSVRRALESFSVSSDWNRWRGRLDRLVVRLEELSGLAVEPPGELRAQQLRQALCRAASEVLDARKTSLVIRDEESHQLRVMAGLGLAVEPEEIKPIGEGEGVAALALERSQPIVVVDTNRDPLFSGFTNEQRYASRSFAIAPLTANGITFGVLCATDRAGGGVFGETDLGMLRLLAAQVSPLIAPGSDAPEVSAEPGGSKESEAKSKRAGQPDVLPKDEWADDRVVDIAREVCHAVIDEVEPGRVIRAALGPLPGLLDAAPVSLHLLDPSQRQLALEAECDCGATGDRPVIQVGGGLTGVAIQTGNMIATADPAADPRFDIEIDTPLSGEVRPFLCLPLKLRGKVVGSFRAFLADGVTPSTRTGEVLAAALSAAVRNALLYRSLVDTIEELADARRESTR